MFKHILKTFHTKTWVATSFKWTQLALLRVAFLLIASHIFVVKSFQNVFIHRLDCSGNFLIFIGCFPHFTRAQSNFKSFQFHWLQIFHLDVSCHNISLGFFSWMFRRLEDIFRGLKPYIVFTIFVFIIN